MAGLERSATMGRSISPRATRQLRRRGPAPCAARSLPPAVRHLHRARVGILGDRRPLVAAVIGLGDLERNPAERVPERIEQPGPGQLPEANARIAARFTREL